MQLQIKLLSCIFLVYYDIKVNSLFTINQTIKLRHFLVESYENEYKF